MARIRTIKPDFWTDEKVVALSPFARLLFIGMWNFVDEAGRCEFSPLRLKMQILPADPVDAAELISEIQCAGLIVVYAADGKQFFQVTNFAKHQKTDPRWPSKLPAPTPERTNSPPITPTPAPGKGKERGEREKERKEDSEANASVCGRDATRTSRTADFEDFWKVYPKRQGSNPKEHARKRFWAAAKSGADPAEIIRAAQAYAAQQQEIGNVGTVFVAQAVTWLSQQRWKDYANGAGTTQHTGPPPGLTGADLAAWQRQRMEEQLGAGPSTEDGRLLDQGEGVRGGRHH